MNSTESGFAENHLNYWVSPTRDNVSFTLVSQRPIVLRFNLWQWNILKVPWGPQILQWRAQQVSEYKVKGGKFRTFAGGTFL